MDNYNLQQTDAKIQAILNKVQPVVDNNTVAGFGNGYAISTTAGATAAKEVTINGFTPTIGGIFSVLFQNGFTASDPTLNVSNTGAKDLKLFGSALPASFVPDGTILTLTYDGTNYNVVGRLNDITVKSTLESTDTPLLQDANGNFIKSTPAALASLLGVWSDKCGSYTGDADDAIEGGCYKIVGQNQTNHFPISGSDGFFLVFSPLSGYILQICVIRSNLYKRAKWDNGSWSDWTTLTFSSI